MLCDEARPEDGRMCVWRGAKDMIENSFGPGVVVAKSVVSIQYFDVSSRIPLAGRVPGVLVEQPRVIAKPLLV